MGMSWGHLPEALLEKFEYYRTRTAGKNEVAAATLVLAEVQAMQSLPIGMKDQALGLDAAVQDWEDDQEPIGFDDDPSDDDDDDDEEADVDQEELVGVPD